MIRLSVCFITRNEEKRLGRALDSLSEVADEIVVVDCGSCDGTEAVARHHRARFFFREWTNYAEQKNYAAECAANEWVFSMDADEELSAELRSSLLSWKKSEPRFSVYEMARRTWYLGAWIRHSGWYPDYQRRLFERDRANFVGIVHESLRFKGTAGRLQGDLLHYTIEEFAEHEEKVARYTTLAAEEMYAAGKREWRAAMWLATPWSWLQNFLLRGGFMDGWRGARIAKMAAKAVWLKYRKLGELVERAPRPR